MAVFLRGNVDEDAFFGAKNIEIEEVIEIETEVVDVRGIERDVIARCHGLIP
jgi:hypothetical protein